MKCTSCGNDLQPGAAFCKTCGAKQNAPAHAAGAAYAPSSGPAATGMSTVFLRDKFFFNQRMFSIREMYHVYDEQGNEILFARRVILALKRTTHIYTDRGQKENILNILQDNFPQIFSKWFTLVDMSGTPLFRFRRKNLLSILRRTWEIFGPDGAKLGEVAEDSWFKSIIRRFLPFGEFLKTDFVFEFGGREVGKFIRKWTIGDKYALDMTADPQRTVDRRAAVAMAILLDTAEAR